MMSANDLTLDSFSPVGDINHKYFNGCLLHQSGDPATAHPNHTRITPESRPNHARITPESRPNHARITPESQQNHIRGYTLSIINCVNVLTKNYRIQSQPRIVMRCTRVIRVFFLKGHV